MQNIPIVGRCPIIRYPIICHSSTAIARTDVLLPLSCLFLRKPARGWPRVLCQPSLTGSTRLCQGADQITWPGWKGGRADQYRRVSGSLRGRARGGDLSGGDVVHLCGQGRYRRDNRSASSARTCRRASETEKLAHGAIEPDLNCRSRYGNSVICTKMGHFFSLLRMNQHDEVES